MTREDLNRFINHKIERQSKLKERKKLMEKLDSQLFADKVSRSFRTFYYFIKRYVLLLIAIVLFILAAVLVISPDLLIKDPEIKRVLVEEYKKDYFKQAGETLGDALNNLLSSNNEMDARNVLHKLDQAIEKTVEKKILQVITYISYLLFFVAIVLFYVSRLTKKLKKRNSMISKADSLTQIIIQEYTSEIEENESELTFLREYFESRV